MRSTATAVAWVGWLVWAHAAPLGGRALVKLHRRGGLLGAGEAFLEEAEYVTPRAGINLADAATAPNALASELENILSSIETQTAVPDLSIEAPQAGQGSSSVSTFELENSLPATENAETAENRRHRIAQNLRNFRLDIDDAYSHDSDVIPVQEAPAAGSGPQAESEPLTPTPQNPTSKDGTPKVNKPNLQVNLNAEEADVVYEDHYVDSDDDNEYIFQTWPAQAGEAEAPSGQAATKEKPVLDWKKKDQKFKWPAPLPKVEPNKGPFDKSKLRVDVGPPPEDYPKEYLDLRPHYAKDTKFAPVPEGFDPIANARMRTNRDIMDPAFIWDKSEIAKYDRKVRQPVASTVQEERANAQLKEYLALQPARKTSIHQVHSTESVPEVLPPSEKAKPVHIVPEQNPQDVYPSPVGEEHPGVSFNTEQPGKVEQGHLPSGEVKVSSTEATQDKANLDSALQEKETPPPQNDHEKLLLEDNDNDDVEESWGKFSAPISKEDPGMLSKYAASLSPKERTALYVAGGVLGGAGVGITTWQVTEAVKRYRQWEKDHKAIPLPSETAVVKISGKVHPNNTNSTITMKAQKVDNDVVV